jgi:hypothetical protein
MRAGSCGAQHAPRAQARSGGGRRGTGGGQGSGKRICKSEGCRYISCLGINFFAAALPELLICIWKENGAAVGFNS